ncbi:hypothetical protein V2J09_013794 [Rumex salicifolius]
MEGMCFTRRKKKKSSNGGKSSSLLKVATKCTAGLRRQRKPKKIPSTAIIIYRERRSQSRSK